LRRKQTGDTKMLMLKTDNLKWRSTNGSYDLAGVEAKPIWVKEDVVVAYKNVLGEELVSVFNVNLKATDEGLILTASGITTLQYFVPESWIDEKNAEIVEYDARYDNLPRAGLSANAVILTPDVSDFAAVAGLKAG
jgi:hypothetical protein